MLSLVQVVLQSVLIRSVKGIEKSFVIERKTKHGPQKVIQTQGINFEECYKFRNIIELNKIETNDIFTMLKKYGVEAARHNIVQEIRNVFGVYGIGVDY
jgi:DNA-directed RNA polymerase I subunit RPA1